MKVIRTEIEKEGQRYVDSAVMHEVSRPNQLAATLAALVNGKALRTIEELSHYERTPLRWMKPDGKGGLIPKGKR